MFGAGRRVVLPIGGERVKIGGNATLVASGTLMLG
jgi:hypothetical protein